MEYHPPLGPTLGEIRSPRPLLTLDPDSSISWPMQRYGSWDAASPTANTEMRKLQHFVGRVTQIDGDSITCELEDRTVASNPCEEIILRREHFENKEIVVGTVFDWRIMESCSGRPIDYISIVSQKPVSDQEMAACLREADAVTAILESA